MLSNHQDFRLSFTESKAFNPPHSKKLLDRLLPLRRKTIVMPYDAFFQLALDRTGQASHHSASPISFSQVPEKAEMKERT